MLSQLTQAGLQTTIRRNYPNAPAQFFAGWFYSLTNEDRYLKIDECLKPNDDLTNTLYAAMWSYIAADYKTGNAKMNEA